MTTSPSQNLLPTLLVCCTLACTTAASPLGQSARDDVPERYGELANPVAPIPENRIRYFEKQYRTQCARCHGAEGAGGAEDTAEGVIPARDFTDAAFMATRTDGQLFYQILVGGGERSNMPGFGPASDVAWSEEKIWSMVWFIRRFVE